jgi:hypothetical protein
MVCEQSGVVNMQRSRVAIYFLAEPGSPLATFGDDVLSARWHPTGMSQEHWKACVADPAVYGFHATIKAPFTPVDEAGPSDVVASLANLARTLAPAHLAPLELAAIGPFIALVERERSHELQALADAVVIGLSPLRAPLSEADKVKRRFDTLDQDTRDRLQRWGYPYVFEHFRFHMTLTGALPEAERASTFKALNAAYLGAVPRAPVVIDRLAVLTQPDRSAKFSPLAYVSLGSGNVIKV